ncbi:hypothetical protein CAEBREN_14400 [Caenorhabditis brenneri]|uniref:Uncharacterized protein n=1 Tax=Caenorhabditis brenneri TaxID=135651 RepID=G0NTT3_CAEBE|nr:hypothetical protein CAEBREN_14400 [Caenorhabditis brenneri]
MIFKHALITCLLLLIHHGAAVERNPYPSCVPNVPTGDEPPVHFLFFLDKVLKPEVLVRLVYLFKAIACEIPYTPVINNSVVMYISGTGTASKGVPSNQLMGEFDRDITNATEDPSSPCERFQKALRYPRTEFLEHENVQFMVPILEETEEDQGCFLRTFQNQYRDHPFKNGFYFNGFLVNGQREESDRKGVRVMIPNLMASIDPNEPNLLASGAPGSVLTSGSLATSYGNLMKNILTGKNVRDWEEESTTTSTPSGFTSTFLRNTTTDPIIVIPLNSDNSTTSNPTTSSEMENEAEKFLSGLDDDYGDEEAENTTVAAVATVLSKRAFPAVTTNTTVIHSTAVPPSTVVESNTTTVTHSTSTVGHRSTVAENTTTTVDATTTTLDQNYDLPEDDDKKLGMVSGQHDNGHYEKENNTIYVKEHRPFKHSQLSSDMLILLLLLLLLIWLFCLFLCLIWMFRCAKRKKNKIEGETEEQLQQQQLLLPLLEHRSTVPHEPSAPKLSTSAESDEDDDWKGIKPAKYTDSTASQNPVKSETETVKRPSSTAQYAPVEVSEFEDKIDDDVDNRPRGYVAAKRAAPLRFD